MKILNKKYKEKGLVLRLVKSEYANNGALYLGLIDDNTKEMYCDITVNLNFSSNCIVELDNDFRNLNSKGLVDKIIKDLKLEYLCEDYSGYCSYPVYFINQAL